MIEVRRLPHDAELALSNALAHLSEAATVLKQYMPDDGDGEDDPAYPWRHNIRKLKMARGIISNVRHDVVNDKAFATLQPERARMTKE
jgi:hypothetical protein